MSSGPKKFDPSEFDRWHQIGMEAMDCESWPYALECLTKAVHANPDHRSARKQKHRASRRVHKQTGDVKKAEGIKLATVKSRLMAAEARSDQMLGVLRRTGLLGLVRGFGVARFITDSNWSSTDKGPPSAGTIDLPVLVVVARVLVCLLYTSDAADE